MGGLTLNEKCEIAGLLYEAQIALTAVSSGLSMIATMVDGGEKLLRLSERLRALGKMVAQSEEALDALDDELEKLLERGGQGAVDKLAVAIDGLEFYADAESWRKTRGASSLIDDDRGSTARGTLAKLDDDGAEE
jgi:hypothetical protein